MPQVTSALRHQPMSLRLYGGIGTPRKDVAVS